MAHALAFAWGAAFLTYSKNGAIAWVLADGNSHEEDLWTGKLGMSTTWFPDGERLRFMELDPNNHLDITFISEHKVSARLPYDPVPLRSGRGSFLARRE